MTNSEAVPIPLACFLCRHRVSNSVIMLCGYMIAYNLKRTCGMYEYDESKENGGDFILKYLKRR